MEETKRGRGRPKTRLEEPFRLRCEVTQDEGELIREACRITGEPQWQFCGRAVVERAKRIIERENRKK